MNYEATDHYFVGFEIVGRYLKGLAIDLERPKTPLQIAISFNGSTMATMRCIGIVYGPQIARMMPETAGSRLGGIREMPGAFEYHLSNYLPLGQPMKVRISVLSDGKEKCHLEKSINLGDETFEALRPLLSSCPLVRFAVTSHDDDSLAVEALVCVEDVELLSLGGENCTLSSIQVADAPAQKAFPDRLKSVRLSARVVPGDEAKEAKVFLCQDGKPIGNFSDALFVPPRFSDRIKSLRAPMAPQIERVMASESKLAYFFSGYASYSVIKHILGKYASFGIDEASAVLDWGVGCGRVAQHVLQVNRAFVGLDIDPENVSWCKANLPGDYEVIPLRPPTPLADQSVELAIGVSVFTHLSEEDQFLWLGELSRIVKPGGYALVTIQSEYACLRSPEPVRRYLSLESYGFDDSVVGSRLDDVLGCGNDYYRETFHSHRYVISHWSRWFDVVAIERGAHFAHQDYVVLRSRRGPA